MKNILLLAECRTKSLTIRVPFSLGCELIANLPDEHEDKKDLIRAAEKEGKRVKLFKMICDMYFEGEDNDE